jgi:hypothetical protein
MGRLDQQITGISGCIAARFRDALSGKQTSDLCLSNAPANGTGQRIFDFRFEDLLQTEAG